MNPQEEKAANRIGDMSGLISKAKEELAKTKLKADVKMNVETDLKKLEPKKSEIEMHWDELIKNMDRDLMLCDLDFRDLTEEDEVNLLMPSSLAKSSIPPPPPIQNGAAKHIPPPFLPFGGLRGANPLESATGNDLGDKTSMKTKKTVN